MTKIFKDTNLDDERRADLRDIENANTPLLRALVMAVALETYIQDVVNDDPGDDNDTAEWMAAHETVATLVGRMRDLAKLNHVEPVIYDRRRAR